VSFDASTWWGEVCYDLTVLPFHGTSFQGITHEYLPKPGMMVTIILNGEYRLLSVEHRVEHTKPKPLPKPKYGFCWWCSRKLVFGTYRKRMLPEGEVIVHVTCDKAMQKKKIGTEMELPKTE
jgi:hypothetical protein